MLDSLLSAGGKILDYFAGKEKTKAAQEMAQQNINLQREFATSGIQWKVADAKAAGIHPLFALGAQTHSFAPVSVGDTPGTNFSGIGQDIGRAINATRSQQQRDEAFTKTARDLELAGKELDNQIKMTTVASQVQRLKQQSNPVMPDSAEPFTVSENKKVEERPPLMLFGKRWMTNPNTSPMKAWEDQYGDEGPVSWTMPLVIGANDALYNVGRLHRWLWSRKREPLF